MKKIRITSGKFTGQEFEIEDYLSLIEGKLFNMNTQMPEALPGDLVNYESQEPVEIEGRKGVLMGHKSEIVLEPTNYQVCLSQPMLGGQHGHVFSAEEIRSGKVYYIRSTTAEYV